MGGKKEGALDIFFRKKPLMMILNLKNSGEGMYASSLAKKVDCTYSHVVKTLQKMKEHNLIVFEKQGRLKLLRLTEKGKEFAEIVDSGRQLLIR